MAAETLPPLKKLRKSGERRLEAIRGDSGDN